MGALTLGFIVPPNCARPAGAESPPIAAQSPSEALGHEIWRSLADLRLTATRLGLSTAIVEAVSDEGLPNKKVNNPNRNNLNKTTHNKTESSIIKSTS